MLNEMGVEAFILIGGRSSRFGADKAFADFEGKTLAQRSVEVVETALPSANPRFVVSNESQFAVELIFRLGRPVVADLKPGFGAWSGLHAALAYSSSEWTFVLACDLPFVSAELIRRLADHTGEECDAVIPRQPDSRLQPLCAFYRRDMVLKKVERQLGETGILPRLTEITSAVNTRIVEKAEYCDLAGNESFFLNINSVGDLPPNIAPN
ncbi:MAG: molybdenum cofactor guanylyltransferase [Pyrinomonadaceae bacterium]